MLRRLPVLFSGDILTENVHHHAVLLPGIDHMLLYPSDGIALQPILTDFFLIILGCGAFLPKMFQRQKASVFFRILRMDVGQGALHVAVIIVDQRILGLCGLAQDDAFALAGFQIYGVHDAETGFEDGSHLHIPLGMSQLLTHSLIYIPEGQNGIAGLLMLPAEGGGGGNIAVVVAVFLLAQKFLLLKAQFHGAAKPVQREAFQKFLLISAVKFFFDP